MNFSANRRTNKTKEQYEETSIHETRDAPVKLQQQYIICASPDDYDGRSIDIQDGDIDKEEYVW